MLCHLCHSFGCTISWFFLRICLGQGFRATSSFVIQPTNCLFMWQLGPAQMDGCPGLHENNHYNSLVIITRPASFDYQKLLTSLPSCRQCFVMPMVDFQCTRPFNNQHTSLGRVKKLYMRMPPKAILSGRSRDTEGNLWHNAN